ncbi:MAG: inositol monophosphatase family protein [Leptospira sp.]|nr:inositol monophosphatase family protein [Leptospira sp.]
MIDSDFENVWRWVLEIGDEILSIYNSDFLVTDKGGNDPVTEADLRASEFLFQKINTHFPDHGFLSEEKKDNELRLSKEWVWILDPIDGTREFVKKNSQFALSLGLVRSGEPIWGIIFNPSTGEFFSKKEFAFNTKLSSPFFTETNFQKLKDASKIPSEILKQEYSIHHKPNLTVSANELKEGMFDGNIWKDNFSITAIGSIAYKLGLLSSGNIDLIVSLKPKSEWDICGGIALLDEEKFRFFPLKESSKYSFNQTNTRSFGLVAGNREAVDYLTNLMPLSKLTSQVKDQW